MSLPLSKERSKAQHLPPVQTSPSDMHLTDIQTEQLLKSLPGRIGKVLDCWVQHSPGHVALRENDVCWSYGQIQAVVSETRAWLIEQGVRPGDRVMLVCENCLAFVALLLALTELDAWPVLVNARL